MKIKFLVSTLALLSLSLQEGVASLRIDLDDRSKEEAYEKALIMAKSYKGSNAVGVICYNWPDENGCMQNNAEIQSAIALDPWTVLTSAHMTNLNAKKGLTFKLAQNAYYHDAKGPAHMGQPLREKVIIHPDFSRDEAADPGSYLQVKDGVVYCDGILMDELAQYSIDQYFDTTLPSHQKEHGVDLAIFKLRTPLPSDLDYPEFFPKDAPVINSLGAFIGYGAMKYNDQRNGPQMAANSLASAYQKHLMSVKLYSYEIPPFSRDSVTHKGSHVLHGHFAGSFINGDESFVPTPTTMKTEGLPVAGDSGGPLFIKVNDKPMLAGIMSRTYTPMGACQLPNTVFRQQENIDYFLTVLQPIFPTWIDVRHYQDWIKSHMGPTKS